MYFMDPKWQKECGIDYMAKEFGYVALVVGYVAFLLFLIFV